MPHCWSAELDPTVLTIRWRSQPGDSVEVQNEAMRNGNANESETKKNNPACTSRGLSLDRRNSKCQSELPLSILEFLS